MHSTPDAKQLRVIGFYNENTVGVDCFDQLARFYTRDLLSADSDKQFEVAFSISANVLLFSQKRLILKYYQEILYLSSFNFCATSNKTTQLLHLHLN